MSEENKDQKLLAKFDGLTREQVLDQGAPVLIVVHVPGMLLVNWSDYAVQNMATEALDDILRHIRATMYEVRPDLRPT